jgi:starvation-inducible DNA-binding protein
MHKTRNDLPADTRKKVVELLNARLADAVDLTTHAKAAHWNVKGPSFIALHELFDKVYAHATECADEIAERCVQLGGVALGTARIAAKNSSLKEYPTDVALDLDHVDALSDRLAAFGKGLRDGIDRASEWRDADTSDLFTELSRANDKMLWFVEAHIQAKRER